MPAGSDGDRAGATSTQVFRPRRARRVVYSCVALVLLVFIGANAWLPTDGRDAWGIGSRLALGGLALAIAYFLHRLANVRVVADDDGLTVANIVHRRRLDWAQVVQVRLAGHDPWLVLNLSDGESIAAMGIQRSEGARAQQQARDLAQLLDRHTRRPRPPPSRQ